MGRLITLVGQRFGRLEVTERGPNAKDGKPTWLCNCDCGQKGKPIKATSLVNGLTQSCGCIRRETSRASRLGKAPSATANMTDEKHGLLTVVRRLDEKYAGGWLWECQCECGGTTKATSGQLRSGHKASCGCARVTGQVVRNAEVRATTNAHKKARYRSESKFRLSQIMFSQMWQALKDRGIKKSGRTFAALGYTPDDLEKRLRRTIPPGFTWGDFMSGRLHIDHETPLSVFNFASVHDEDFHRAWALTNLRLLPSAENWSKGAKLSKPFQPTFAFGPSVVTAE